MEDNTGGQNNGRIERKNVTLGSIANLFLLRRLLCLLLLGGKLVEVGAERHRVPGHQRVHQLHALGLLALVVGHQDAHPVLKLEDQELVGKLLDVFHVVGHGDALRQEEADPIAVALKKN